MTKQLKRYIIVQAIISFFVNGILNGIIAYFLNKNNQIETITMPQNYLNLIIDIGVTALIFAWLIAWSVNAEFTNDEYPAVAGREEGSWFWGEMSMRLGDRHQLLLGGGETRKGQVCSGGVCKLVDAFEGGRLELLTTF